MNRFGEAIVHEPFGDDVDLDVQHPAEAFGDPGDAEQVVASSRLKVDQDVDVAGLDCVSARDGAEEARIRRTVLVEHFVEFLSMGVDQSAEERRIAPSWRGPCGHGCHDEPPRV